MENPLVTTLTVTFVGMGVVFAAMGLILGSMALLTRLARQAPTGSPSTQNQAPAPANPAIGVKPPHQTKLRAAAVAVALLRARQTREAEDLDPEPPVTPWGDYYRQRQLRPSGRGRIV